MLRFVFSPNWFYGIDSAFEILAFAITFIISMYCYFRYYKMCESSSYKYFSYSFLAISLSFLFKILTNISIVYEEITKQAVGPLTFTITEVKTSHLLLLLGTTLHYFFFLLGLLMLFLIIYKERHKHTIVLSIFFIGMLTLFSQSTYLVFYLSTVVFTAFIFHKYWGNFKAKKTRSSLLLALSFLMLIFSHIAFMLVNLNLQIYVVAETLQLFAFILLLLTFMSVVNGRAIGAMPCKPSR